tara:strand:- start:75 stop:494 length:420 start_codon:yes stop_codon:yes gene_type:complete
MTMKINASFDARMREVDAMYEEQLEAQVQRLADFTIDTTLGNNRNNKAAIDTGAYITSFSITTGRGRPRGKGSRGKKRNNPNIMGLADEGRANLYGDIAKLDLANTTSLTLRNNSPHAEFVEYKHKYYIFARIEREFNG